MITVEEIKAEVCRYYRLPAIEMVSDRRSRKIARPRQVAMYLARQLTPLSLPNIGRLFGGRDHTTVRHAVQQIAATKERKYREAVRKITARLKENERHITIEDSPSDHWKDADLAKLIEMAGSGSTAKETAIALGRTPAAVRTKAYNLKIPFRYKGGKPCERLDHEYKHFVQDAKRGSELLKNAILRLAA